MYLLGCGHFSVFVNVDLQTHVLTDSLLRLRAGFSVRPECEEEVQASQWKVSLLLLLLKWRSQRGSLRLPRNHARYTVFKMSSQKDYYLIIKCLLFLR